MISRETVAQLQQSVENQEAELRATAERMGHEIVAVYRDKGIGASLAVITCSSNQACCGWDT